MDKLLEGVGRSIVFSKARASVMKETHGNYPAPLEALAAVEKGFGRPLAEALKLEVEAISRLVGTPAMKSLVNLFFRMEEVKKETGVAAGVAALPVKRIGVLGAGAMGGGIAQLASDKGWPVRMKDIRHEALAAGYAQAAKIWQEQAQEAPDDPDGVRGEDVAPFGRPLLDGFDGCDVTIEAVLEKLAVKQAVLKEWEAVARPDAIFASNTSTLPSPRSRRRRPAPSGSSGCTSSTRSTRCRSSR